MKTSQTQKQQSRTRCRRATESQSYSYLLSLALNKRQSLFKTMFFLVFSIMYFLPVKAQLIGWPTSGGAEIDISSGTINTTAITYMDNNRARVTSQTLVTSTPLVYDIQLTNLATGASFALNKWCAIVQMTSPTDVGLNCMVKTIAFNTGTNVMRIEVLTGNTWPTYDFASTSRVQIVRIPVYWDLTLTKGEISCSKYDYTTGTGGLLPLIVGNQMTINGGFFNTVGKGYENGWASGSNPLTSQLGQGGAGATALPYGSFPFMSPYPAGVAGNVSTPGAICWGGGVPPPLPTFTIGNNGQIGEGPNNTGAMGTTTNTGNVENYYPSSPASSSVYSILRMGNAGNAGMDGGQGGGAGGAGGYGGLNGSAFGFLGGPSSIGLNGEDGGNAKMGGIGGGIMYIKFAKTAISSTISGITGYKLFFTDGGNGQNGEQGGDGGAGGQGQMGQDGICSGGTGVFTAGGWGGFGASGKGAGGGDAGDGGKPGTIWIIKKSPNSNHPTAPLKNYFSIRGGKGGGGGVGGYRKDFVTNFKARNYLPNPPGFNGLPCLLGQPYTLCIDPPVCQTVVCDCDEVFKHWGTDGASGYTVDATTNPSLWTLTFVNSSPTIYFNPTTKYLYYTKVVGFCSIRYDCYMIKSEMFLDIMKKAFAVNPLETYLPPSGSNVTVGTNDASYNNISLITKINFYLNPDYHFTLEYNANTDKLIDIDNPGQRYVEAVKCGNTQYVYNSLTGFSYGNSGSGETPPGESQNIVVDFVQDGDTGDDGADAPDGDGDNMGEQDGGAFPPPSYDNNGDGIMETNYALPDIAKVTLVNMGLAIDVFSAEIGTWQQCSVYSLDGKLIATNMLENGKTNFNYMASGVYVLVFTGNGKSRSQKIIVP